MYYRRNSDAELRNIERKLKQEPGNWELRLKWLRLMHRLQKPYFIYSICESVYEVDYEAGDHFLIEDESDCKYYLGFMEDLFHSLTSNYVDLDSAEIGWKSTRFYNPLEENLSGNNYSEMSFDISYYPDKAPINPELFELFKEWGSFVPDEWDGYYSGPDPDSSVYRRNIDESLQSAIRSNDPVQIIKHKLRSGLLTQNNVALAAMLGDPAAKTFNFPVSDLVLDYKIDRLYPFSIKKLEKEESLDIALFAGNFDHGKYRRKLVSDTLNKVKKPLKEYFMKHACSLQNYNRIISALERYIQGEENYDQLIEYSFMLEPINFDCNMGTRVLRQLLDIVIDLDGDEDGDLTLLGYASYVARRVISSHIISKAIGSEKVEIQLAEKQRQEQYLIQLLLWDQ